MHTPITPPPFDVRAAQEVCRRVVSSHHNLFAAFPDITHDDLQQEAMTAVLRAAPKFDATHGATWTTWVSRCAYCRLVDLYRSKTAHLKHESLHKGEIIDGFDAAQANYVNNLSDELLGVAEGAIHAAESSLPRYARTGPHIFTIPQLAAIIAVRHAMNLSHRRVVHLLRRRQDVRERLGLTRIPSFMTLFNAENTIRIKVSALRKNKHEQQAQHQQPQRLEALGTRRGVDEYAHQESLGNGPAR